MSSTFNFSAVTALDSTVLPRRRKHPKSYANASILLTNISGYLVFVNRNERLNVYIAECEVRAECKCLRVIIREVLALAHRAYSCAPMMFCDAGIDVERQCKGVEAVLQSDRGSLPVPHRADKRFDLRS